MYRATLWTVRCVVALAILAAGTPGAWGDNITITATADGAIYDTNGDGTWDSVNTTSSNLTVRQFAGIVQDRSIVVFNLSTIPITATVTSVSFTFRTLATTTGTDSLVGINGYTGNGMITISDATLGATFVANYDSTALGVGPQTIPLGAAGVTVLNSARSSTGILELRLQSFGNTVNTSAGSLEMGSTSVPQLLIVTAVPEPATLAAVGAGLAVLAGSLWHYRRRRALRADLPDLCDVD